MNNINKVIGYFKVSYLNSYPVIRMYSKNSGVCVFPFSVQGSHERIDRKTAIANLIAIVDQFNNSNISIDDNGYVEIFGKRTNILFMGYKFPHINDKYYSL